LIYQLNKVSHHFFPELSDWLGEVKDHRIDNCCKYSMSNLLTQVIHMFQVQGSTRNNMNQLRKDGSYFKDNFEALHGDMQLAHFDTVNNVIKTVDAGDLILVLGKMINALIRSKVINPAEGYYHIVMDATGVASYHTPPLDGALSKKKNNTTTYYASVLEAKIITDNGLCLSVASELLSNEGKGFYDKQDCELAAFSRLADQLHKLFPRLPICLHLDGLYANATVMKKCEQYGWKYIITRKDGNLPKLDEQIKDTLEKVSFVYPEVLNPGQKEANIGDVQYLWAANLQHQNHQLNYMEGRFPKHNSQAVTKFAYITNLNINLDSPQLQSIVRRFMSSGRSRWLIENKGFNDQKNNGFNMEHKFVRKSIMNLYKYYILLQIAHIIHQLTIKSKAVVKLVKQSKVTIKMLWDRLKSVLLERVLCKETIMQNRQRCQIRLE
jgi:hypothetical protein